MIQKILKARNIGDMLRYLLGPIDSSGRTRPRVEIIDSVFAGRDEWELSREISAIVARRPTLKRNIFHSTLRLSPRDRQVSDPEWSRICRRYVGELGFDTFLVVSHFDHVHILAPRVRLDTSVVPDNHDFARGEKIVRQAEVDFGLERVRPSHLLLPEVDYLQMRTLSTIDEAKFEIKDVEPPIYVVQRAILEALQDEPSTALREFEQALSRRGIKLVRRLSPRDSRLQLAFIFDGRTYGPRKLGGQFSAEGLSKLGLKFLPNAPLENTVPQGDGKSENALLNVKETAVLLPLAHQQQPADPLFIENLGAEEPAPDADVPDESPNVAMPRPF